MSLEDYFIKKKPQETVVKERIFNSMFDVDKYNTVYSIGAIDVISCLLQVGKQHTWSHKELINVLESYRNNEYVLKNKDLQEYLDILIKNHTA